MHRIKVTWLVLMNEDMAFSCLAYLLTFCKHIVLVVLWSGMLILTNTIVLSAKTVLLTGHSVIPEEADRFQVSVSYTTARPCSKKVGGENDTVWNTHSTVAFIHLSIYLLNAIIENFPYRDFFFLTRIVYNECLAFCFLKYDSYSHLWNRCRGFQCWLLALHSSICLALYCVFLPTKGSLYWNTVYSFFKKIWAKKI